MRVLAPIALFAYDRLGHLQRTVEALRRNSLAAESRLYVFSDGPRDTKAKAGVEQVRAYLHALTGFQTISLVEREANLGLARSIIDGVSRLCEEHGRVIVMEDDLVTSPHFLRFMNDGLDRYQDNEAVASIHGYVLPVKGTLPETFFLKGADCWGWATWHRAWKLFNPDGRDLLRQLEERQLTRRFDMDGSFPYTRMLRRQIAGRYDSWAIRWHASAFLQNRLTLYPGRSLVLNIGTDGSGRHVEATNTYAGTVSDTPIDMQDIPVTENVRASSMIAEFHRSSRSFLAPGSLRKLARYLTGWGR